MHGLNTAKMSGLCHGRFPAVVDVFLLRSFHFFIHYYFHKCKNTHVLILNIVQITLIRLELFFCSLNREFKEEAFKDDCISFSPVWLRLELKYKSILNKPL